MTLTEPTSVFLETGPLAVFEKADGSGDPVESRGLLENAVAERESGQTTRQQADWQFTGSTDEIGSFGEGDSVTLDEASNGFPVGTEFTILDTIAQDEAHTIFALTAA